MRLLRENASCLDPEEQALRGLWGQSFGSGTTFLGAVDELIEVQKRLRRK